MTVEIRKEKYLTAPVVRSDITIVCAAHRQNYPSPETHPAFHNDCVQTGAAGNYGSTANSVIENERIFFSLG